MTKIKVGVLGATGMVGQRFIQLLHNHPWFELNELVVSPDNAAKTYAEAVYNKWIVEGSVPENVADMTVISAEELSDSDIYFSALPHESAKLLEEKLASEGKGVLSNVAVNRMKADVPLMVPEVNPEHAELINIQRKNRGGSGFIVTNPNCSTIPLTIVLKALEKFNPEKVLVTTMQAISGAGYPGVPSLDMIDNIVPFIAAEEEKIQTESLKILGSFSGKDIENANIAVSASCNRCPVRDGHLESVSIKFGEQTSVEKVIEALKNFKAEPQRLELPTAPHPAIIVMEQQNRPQPVKDRLNGNGMAITVGRVRECNVLDIKLTVLGHNTIRGAAGASVLNAELLHKKGFF